MRRLIARGVVVAVVAALAGGFWQSARATTTPSTTLIVEVLVTEKSIVVGKYASSATHDGFIPMGGPIPRGDYLNFTILNRGKRPLSFSAFGRKTKQPVKPGGRGHFNVLALKRGKFPYHAIVTGGKTFAGTLIVE